MAAARERRGQLVNTFIVQSWDALLPPRYLQNHSNSLQSENSQSIYQRRLLNETLPGCKLVQAGP